MKSLLVVLRDGRVGAVKKICQCEECRKRNELEFLLVSLDGEYLDYIKVSDCIKEEYVLNAGYSVNQLGTKNNVGELLVEFIYEILTELSTDKKVE